MQYENLFRAFATLGSNNGYFRKEVPSVRCILESSSRCPNILTVAPPNNLVLHVPCRPPIIPVCGRTYHAVCLKSRWGWLGTYAYGTLRSGERNERFCRNAVSRRIATISGTLYDTGWGFPAFVPKGKTKVAVELIEIPIRDWADVDRLEGYPRLYDRILTDFCLPDGSTVQAWIYTMNHLPEQAKVIPSGDWKAR